LTTTLDKNRKGTNIYNLIPKALYAELGFWVYINFRWNGL